MLADCGLELMTTEEEFNRLDVPYNRQKACYMYNCRKVTVRRNGVVSEPTLLYSLLNGQTQVRSQQEKDEHNARQSQQAKKKNPMGTIHNNESETKAINDLNHMLGGEDVIRCVHLLEFRRADVAYCLVTDDISREVFVAEQVKSCYASYGKLTFQFGSKKLTTSLMIKILESGMSLICIGKDPDTNLPAVVWFFFGNKAITMLKKFDSDQPFGPMLYPQRPNALGEFAKAYNQSDFRFDVGKSVDECQRLLACKLQCIKTGTKHTLKFLNEDPSQIPSEAHQIEQLSFEMTREACQNVGATVERFPEHANGPIDYIVNAKTSYVRVQDKCLVDYKGVMGFGMKTKGRPPYHPNHFDILQLTDRHTKLVYVLPMRVLNNEGDVVSFFTEKYLLTSCPCLNKEWRIKHSQYLHDLSTEEGQRDYVAECEYYSKIPELTDKNFYENMISGETFEGVISKKRRLEREARMAAHLTSRKGKEDEEEEHSGTDSPYKSENLDSYQSEYVVHTKKPKSRRL